MWGRLSVVLVVAGCTSGERDRVLLPPDMAAGLCATAQPPPSNNIGVPSFGDVIEIAPSPPPPLSGGTLLLTRGQRVAVAADPDRDVVWVVDLQLNQVHAVAALRPGDEPGRLTEDGAGRIHVVMRRGGALVTITTDGETLARRDVCPSPRGVAWDPSGDLVHVACAGGELVSLPAADGPPTRTLMLDRDLRDVVVDGDRLLVSRFRSAELLVVAADGRLIERKYAATFREPDVRAGAAFTPAVAWRTIAGPGGGALMLHQRGDATPIAVSNGFGSPPDGGVDTGMGGGSPYGGGVVVGTSDPCRSVVHATITSFAVGQWPVTASDALRVGALPVDLAITGDGRFVFVVAAGEAHRRPGADVVRFDTAPALAPATEFDCATAAPQAVPVPVQGEATSVAVTDGYTVVVQTREPATLQLFPGLGAPPGRTIQLGGGGVADTGHAIFHSDSGAGVACASCHAEGGEDGRTWRFDFGDRRTQSLRGGVSGRAPFHWSGNLPDLDHLTTEVFVRRMGGPPLSCGQVGALERWLDTIPVAPAPRGPDDAAVVRGEALFNGTAGCASCHSGALFTNDAVVDVGTGGQFKVPSLRGVAWHAPYLHDGCAPTLRDRFGPCGGAMHGATAQLADADVADLVAWLESL